MMGEEIVRVQTTYIPFSREKPESARYVIIQLQFESGALGCLECNADSGYGYEISVSITGESGVVQSSPLPSPMVRRSNAIRQWVEEDWLQRFRVAYIDEVRAWAGSVREGTAIGPSAWDGYAAMLVADASIASGKQSKPVEVELPPRPSIYG